MSAGGCCNKKFGKDYGYSRGKLEVERAALEGGAEGQADESEDNDGGRELEVEEQC